ncbi:MAG: DUF389 domain-containing protein [Actinomycetes bacterium]
MPKTTLADVERMTDALYIDGPFTGAKSSKFWILLVLAGIIATAGVIADSTATVIGAMIVAPLMTPILGTALAVVLADHRHMVRSVALVAGGALIVIAIAFLLGVIDSPVNAFQGNSQIEGRISPGLIDLVAALATGTVGAFALVRSDISDTLPGVAIAISLVPPLAVVGLLLSVQRYSDAMGALLLFATNVAAIIATGAIVLLLYRIRSIAEDNGYPVGVLRGRTLFLVMGLVVIVAIPLAVGSAAVARDQLLEAKVRPIAVAWAAVNDWTVTEIAVRDGVVAVAAIGAPPDVKPEELRKLLNDKGIANADLAVVLATGGGRLCPAGSEICHAIAQ